MRPTARAPAMLPTIIFQLATPVQMRMMAPRRMAMTEVSPTEPGTVPMKRSQKPVPYWADAPSRASGVAPVKPSTTLSALLREIQQLEPDM